MSAVDVLGAMDDACDDLDNFRMHSETLRAARDAVRALIEAAAGVIDSIDCNGHVGCEIEQEFRAALAKVSGGGQ